MSWMVMATSWAPPGSQPDMWVLSRLRGQVGGLPQGGCGFPLNVFIPQRLLSTAPLLCPLNLSSPPGPTCHLYEPQPGGLVQPRLSPRHPCFSPDALSSPLRTVPISPRSPSGPSFSDLLIGEGRIDPRAFPSLPGTWDQSPGLSCPPG